MSPTKFFIAAPITELPPLQELDRAWAYITENLPSNLETIRQTNPHITIKFIGETRPGHPAPNDLNRLNEAVQHIAQRFIPIQLTLGPICTFPGIAWASVTGEHETLYRLHQLHHRVNAIVQSMQDAGSLPTVTSQFRFTPHITLGKFPPQATIQVARINAGTPPKIPTPFNITVVKTTTSLTGHPPILPNAARRHKTRDTPRGHPRHIMNLEKATRIALWGGLAIFLSGGFLLTMAVMLLAAEPGIVIRAPTHIRLTALAGTTFMATGVIMAIIGAILKIAAPRQRLSP